MSIAAGNNTGKSGVTVGERENFEIKLLTAQQLIIIVFNMQPSSKIKCSDTQSLKGQVNYPLL